MEEKIKETKETKKLCDKCIHKDVCKLIKDYDKAEEVIAEFKKSTPRNPMKLLTVCPHFDDGVKVNFRMF